MWIWVWAWDLRMDLDLNLDLGVHLDLDKKTCVPCRVSHFFNKNVEKAIRLLHLSLKSSHLV